jgi:hypothetical protein
MSELKPVMVRLPPEVYEKLRASAFDLAMPPAVLARVLIKKQLEVWDDPEEFEEPTPPASPSPSSSSRQRSGRSKRRKNKKRGR